jgi:hypothetical protein
MSVPLQPVAKTLCFAIERSPAPEGQTFQYQNTASRIGFLLVLDQTDRGGQVLHLAYSIRPMKLTPKDESEPRYVVMCRISGDRCTPSDLSKPKKKSQRK